MKNLMMMQIISRILFSLRFIFWLSHVGMVKKGVSVGRLLKVNMMDEAFNDKAEQFERLWDGITPKGINRNKSLKFRQYILEHVRQMRRPLTRDNARKYWMGVLQAEIAERENF